MWNKYNNKETTKQLVVKKRVDPEILKMGRTLCQPPWLGDKEKFRFQMVWRKDQNNVKNYKFMANYLKAL